MQGVKRLLDILAAGLGLCLLCPLLLLLAMLVLCTEGWPLIYREERVGRDGKLFPLYKFRTLRTGSSDERSVAPEDDPRITGAGLWLRRWRLDEFPQLVNVLVGHMSLVGPRPMPPTHAREIPPSQLSIVLSVRPGITDPAALHFLAEDAVLAGQEDAEILYIERFLPAKTNMQIKAVQQWSFSGDIKTLAQTLRHLWSRDAREQSAHAMRKLLAGVKVSPGPL
jgi:lipopolysaccharide/colanic/teichoic acid biosynthesis glycosyltransferase